MQDKIWTMLSISLSIIALILVVILFIITFTSKDQDKQVESRVPKMNFPTMVDVVANRSVKLNNPPNFIDGVKMKEGNTVYLNAQENKTENGFYEIVSNNEWSPMMIQETFRQEQQRPQLSHEGHMMYVRNGNEFGSNMMMLDGQHSGLNPITRSPCIIKDNDIASSCRRLTTDEIKKGIIICEANVILPDPSEFNFLDSGQLLKVSIVNRNEEEIVEIGYSSHWVSKCLDTNVEPMSGISFILRYVGDGNGEVYRVSN